MKGHRQGMGFGDQARETVEREKKEYSVGGFRWALAHVRARAAKEARRREG
jgi:hypothetical protein